MIAKSVPNILFTLLEEYGVRRVVCSPGSRNAAIVVEADKREDLKKYVVIDERVAGFVAMGMALTSREPVALVCTSGSALLNYGPAVAEAFYQGIPLIVISADRPAEWIDQDDSQTINQCGALNNIVKGYYDLNGEDLQENNLWYANRLINEGLQKALRQKRGPVHFNIHLSGIVDNSETPVLEARKIDVELPPQRLSSETINSLAQKVCGMKIMVVAGFMPPDNKLQKACLLMRSLPNVCFMAETVSNLHLPPEDYVVDSVFFKHDESFLEKYRPDLVISLGGALISRKLKEFLRSFPPQHVWTVGYSDKIIDCFKSLTLKIETEPATFIQSLAKRLSRLTMRGSNSSDYAQSWSRLRIMSTNPVDNVPWSDLRALSLVLDALPEDTNLFLSNGTSVRYAQIIPYPLTHATFSNRGVSGIEGSTSTAIGGAVCYDRTTCLITGDMSFVYDLGALSSGLATDTLRIVVLDNAGGEIFRFIPATKNLGIREHYLSADPESPVELLADSFNFEYFFADSIDSLRDSLEEFFSPSIMPRILHISTRNCPNNSEILRDYLSINSNKS